MQKVLKALKLVDDSNELNYTTLFGIVACVKVLAMQPQLDIPGLVALMTALGAHHYQESNRN